jgi:hypothetical protein
MPLISMTASRVAYLLPPLELVVPGTYEPTFPDGVVIGKVVWNRGVATSDFMWGQVEVTANKQMKQASLKLDVRGVDITTIYANIKALNDAMVEQYTWTLTRVEDGVVQQDLCQRADWQLVWDQDFVYGYIAHLTYEFPVTPDAFTGTL